MDKDDNVVITKQTKQLVGLSNLEREMGSQHEGKSSGVANTDESPTSFDSPRSGGPYARNPQRHAETISNHEGQYTVPGLDHLASNLSGANHNGAYIYGANDLEADRASDDSDLRRKLTKPSKNIGKIVFDDKENFGWRPSDNNKTYWIPSSSISSDVLDSQISNVGSFTTYRKFEFRGRMGFLIENAEQFMDSAQVRKLETMSTQARLRMSSELPQNLTPSLYLAKEPVRVGNFGSPLHQAILANPNPGRLKDPSFLYQFGGQGLEKVPQQISVDLDKQCGVTTPNSLFGPQCLKDLTCKIHSEELKMQVTGRSLPYRVLEMRAHAGFGAQGNHLPAINYSSGNNDDSTILSADTKSKNQSLQKKSITPIRIVINKGDHLELKNSEEKKRLPYVLEGNLGHGGSASVEMVRDLNTDSVYARKIIRNVYTRNLETVKLSFLNEVRVMRLLASHHHMIQVFATYIAQRELALILSPVADGGDLHDFLGRYQDAGTDDPERAEKTTILHRAFGCLASGLAFMHQERVRHKDIKPKNILIHQGSVLYTDFGISFDFSQQEQSTTIGNPHSYTKRYCAPEVADWGNRNSKSDIFSLGCVFIEILAAIHPHLFNDTFLEGPFYDTLDELSCERLIQLDKFCYWCVEMLQEMLQKSPTDRPTAATLVERIDTSDFDLFCDTCSSDQNSKHVSSHSFESSVTV